MEMEAAMQRTYAKKVANLAPSVTAPIVSPSDITNLDTGPKKKNQGIGMIVK